MLNQVVLPWNPVFSCPEGLGCLDVFVVPLKHGYQKHDGNQCPCSHEGAAAIMQTGPCTWQTVLQQCRCWPFSSTSRGSPLLPAQAVDTACAWCCAVRSRGGARSGARLKYGVVTAAAASASSWARAANSVRSGRSAAAPLPPPAAAIALRPAGRLDVRCRCLCHCPAQALPLLPQRLMPRKLGCGGDGADARGCGRGGVVRWWAHGGARRHCRRLQTRSILAAQGAAPTPGAVRSHAPPSSRPDSTAAWAGRQIGKPMSAWCGVSARARMQVLPSRAGTRLGRWVRGQRGATWLRAWTVRQ